MALYFDHNATTPLDERVLAAMLPFLNRFYGNPSSLYKQARLVRSAIDTARDQVASLVNAQPSQVIFTSGGTEANNLALNAIHQQRLAISAIEHPSISVTASQLAANLYTIPVDSNGVLIPLSLELLNFQPDLVALMLANNETGAIQPVHTYSQALKARGIGVHTDAVQAVGKISVDFQALGVASLALSSHKLYGPQGAGALIVENHQRLTPLLHGGAQERGYRAGTENVAAIVGFGKAAELAQSELTLRQAHLFALRRLLEEQLSALPRVCVFAKDAPRLPNTVQFGIEGMDGEMLLMQLDSKGVAVSSGSACASGGNAPSPVLTAMGVSDSLAKSALRLSLGMNNTPADINTFITLLSGLLGIH